MTEHPPVHVADVQPAEQDDEPPRLVIKTEDGGTHAFPIPEPLYVPFVETVTDLGGMYEDTEVVDVGGGSLEDAVEELPDEEREVLADIFEPDDGVDEFRVK